MTYLVIRTRGWVDGLVGWIVAKLIGAYSWPLKRDMTQSQADDRERLP